MSDVVIGIVAALGPGTFMVALIAFLHHDHRKAHGRDCRCLYS